MCDRRVDIVIETSAAKKDCVVWNPWIGEQSMPLCAVISFVLCREYEVLSRVFTAQGMLNSSLLFIVAFRSLPRNPAVII